MKRIQEKVKDLVDVLSFEGLQDFISNPAQTLSTYHFTDITSNMMSQWLERILNVNSSDGGMAYALAGYRGVGKSHFLATIGMIAAHPELRSRINDPHVASTAQGLKRRHYPVAYVRRGTFPTLLEEIKKGLADLLETPPDALSGSLSEMLTSVASQMDDLPLIILIDTAYERTSRVARDDGELLGEIAEIAKKLNVFVAVALDDDITSADGVNSAIVRTYKIDYLDQEHLYYIVNKHIFPNYRQALPVLNEIYRNFKRVLPNFRWSEQRFVSLYPLHPVILEIAPSIRLYAPEFTLLTFAAEAGRKIMGRPANSLIALDEIFDKVEESLRKVPDLKQAFETFDKLNDEIITQIPVMERLRAKLILKGFLLLSLEGEGTTAGGIQSAMLIYDEDEPGKAKLAVEELLKTFVALSPDNIQQIEEEDRETRYSLKVESKDYLNNVLAESTKDVSKGVIPKILRRMARELFFDWEVPDEKEPQTGDSVECVVNWRGGLRTGRIIWDLESEKTFRSPDKDKLDWEVVIDPHEVAETPGTYDEIPRAYWQPAPLKKSEAETILRYFVLLTNPKLHEEFGEQVQAAGYSYTSNVERIWQRIFLQDAKFVINGVTYSFTDDARLAKNLSELFSIMLKPLFKIRYPNHPFFIETLGMNEVSLLVNDYFSGAKQNVPEVQQLAEMFALPLQLVDLRDDFCHLESEENITRLSLSKEILSLVDKDNETVSLKKVYQKVKNTPYGLTREAQHLILAALVAHRRIEFVTSKGDRINRRSLDLKIIWEDIVGIAKPAVMLYDGHRLAAWATILTDAEGIDSVDTAEDRQLIHNALNTWLKDWDNAKVLERFNELPEEILNTQIWQLSNQAEKSFGAAAGIVGEITNENITIDDGLRRIADTFIDSEDEFFARTMDLVVLEDFIKGAKERDKFWSYLAICETTEDEKIEHLREELLETIEISYFEPKDAYNREMRDLWEGFHNNFTEYFATKHDSIMKSHQLSEKFDEIIRSDEWWEFENLASLPFFSQSHLKKINEICRHFKELNCKFDVREMLKTHPFCACSFDLTRMNEWVKLPERLTKELNNARESYRKTLKTAQNSLIPLIQTFPAKTNDTDFSTSADHLVEVLRGNEEIPLLTTKQLIILQKVAEEIPSSSYSSSINTSVK